MWGTVGPRVVHLSPLERVRLRRIAVRYAMHGWEVTPGACLARSRFVCGRAGCPTVGCHPALENWELAASTDPARVATWWHNRPHGVLLPTGRAFDVLEVPSYLGQHVLDAISDHPADRSRGPVAVTPTGRWMFLVLPGDPLRPELDHCFHVVRHGVGSWIPAPPTRLPEGPVRWALAPEQARWRLPDSYLVQKVMVDALRATGIALTADLLPGQLPLPRRGF
ncbi:MULTISPECIES: bifunctional DNA primase/polymerase [Micromonospora]|uniref:Bifunctional DNA primase/polymerase, N-terminal n=2 Tax=Micromonospora TaxID=1873 RepID=A0A1C6S0C7_9ACTN|nr:MULTISPECIES: bifunctional DNA primase/polymerase [Micromonospora]TWJ27959.1 bifunctional DNA primase/polymerase-like protein [Micromonospora sagamiensis]BCL13152.1 DNA primase [Micromonospora sagamiensis]SCL22911.1 Bifunctional DNA primase/polymerase, N-terminal [Micromonospora inyonensis]